MDNFLGVIFFFTISFNEIENANILAIVPTPFYSHQATFRPLWKALAENGHNITLITTNPMESHQNISQIDLSATYSILDKYEFGKMLLGNMNIFRIVLTFPYLADEFLKFQLSHLDQVKDPSKYHCDLIIAEISVTPYYALSKKLDCPLILISSMDASSLFHGYVGNAVHPAMYSYSDYTFEEDRSFLSRLTNTFIMLSLRPFFFCSSVLLDLYVEEFIGKGLPQINEILTSISLIIVNSNPIFYCTRASTPTTISLGGGLHFKEPLPLPKDLQVYLDESKHGCIYFSFGSMVDSNYLSEEVLETFRKTFEQLAPIRVLWKFANDTMTLKPSNLELRKWIPQHDVLRHPNVKLFITHGGLQSMEESIDSAVPMLGMPFYGDQISNVKKMVMKGFGLSLDVTTMNENSLKTSILELMANPKYKKTIQRLSSILKDQPMGPVEKAVWWIEYVLRHGTTEHLKSPSADIPLYQYFFLDIMAFLFVVLSFVLISFYYSFILISRIFRAILSRKTKLKVN